MTVQLARALAQLQQPAAEQHDAIVAFCRKHHIRTSPLFDSILCDDFDPDSDVEMLVEFEPDHVPALALIRIQDELSRLFGDRPVDLVTPRFLNPPMQDRVLEEARIF
jgi:predicted nucleotidyltransferase